jgi:hypothetical protein
LSDKVALVKEVKAANAPAPVEKAKVLDSTIVKSDTVAKIAMK